MNLKDQVTNLELAKKLKELGVKQNAFWSWFDTTDRDDTPRLNTTDENLGVLNLPQQPWEAKYSAFTVSELGEMLPKGFYSGRNDFLFCYLDIERLEIKGRSGSQTTTGDTEADVRAKMLIYLLENKLIKLGSQG